MRYEAIPEFDEGEIEEALSQCDLDKLRLQRFSSAWRTA
jgi:hypothetical protein